MIRICLPADLIRSALLVLLLAGVAPQAWGQTAQRPALPAGEGGELLAAACTQCHGLNTIMAMRDGAAGWRLFVYDMILRGAQLNSREADIVIDYLLKNYGPGVPLARTGASGAVVAALPAGPGKELVEARCTLCHGADRVVSVSRTAGDWEGIVKNMVARGAVVPDDEVQPITSYLAAHFGKK